MSKLSPRYVRSMPIAAQFLLESLSLSHQSLLSTIYVCIIKVVEPYLHQKENGGNQ